MPDSKKEVVVIGGGAAGMEAAGQLARAGCMVTLLEKDTGTGGHVHKWYHLFPDRKDSNEVIEYLDKQVNHKNITTLTGTEVSSLQKNGRSIAVRTTAGNEIRSDAVIIATGFDLFESRRKEEYGDRKSVV